MTSKLFLIGSTIGLNKIFWLEAGNKLKIHSLTNNGELICDNTIPYAGVNAKIIESNLSMKNQDWYFMQTETERLDESNEE